MACPPSSACPRTMDLLGRQAAIPLDPKFSGGDVADIVAGIRKAFRA